jgi:hypothetical protein
MSHITAATSIPSSLPDDWLTPIMARGHSWCAMSAFVDGWCGILNNGSISCYPSAHAATLNTPAFIPMSGGGYVSIACTLMAIWLV